MVGCDLTAERLRSVLSYDPETGLFRWRVKPNRNIVIGSVAGSRRSAARGRNDIGIRIDGRQHAAHRLAWLYVHGKWPADQIDHINCDASDNRIANLREATAAQNQANRRIGVANTSGVKGVCWHKRERRWYASIKVNGKSKHLGRFKSKKDAAVAYWFASIWFKREFARAE